jgi:hypothetical protein
MKRAVVSPLLSLVVPGLGQLINRQAGKGAVLVMGSGLIFMGVFGLFVYKLSQAGNQVAQLPPAQQTMQALSRALWEQGVAGLAALLGLYAALLLYGVVDAAASGRRLDRAADGEEG